MRDPDQQSVAKSQDTEVQELIIDAQAMGTLAAQQVGKNFISEDYVMLITETDEVVSLMTIIEVKWL